MRGRNAKTTLFVEILIVAILTLVNGLLSMSELAVVSSRPARLKVLATLPPEWQADAQHVNARFHLDAVDWFHSAARTEHLGAVADAVWCERRLHIRYESWNGVRERDVEPLGLVLKAGVWYVAARTGPNAEPRTYRLSNILALTTLAQRFSAPRGFDLAAYWQESTRRFETGLYNETASLRVSPRGWRLLRQFSTAVAEAADQSAGLSRHSGRPGRRAACTGPGSGRRRAWWRPRRKSAFPGKAGRRRTGCCWKPRPGW